MTMTNDPYRAPEVPADPTRHETDPVRVDLEERRPTIWLPIAIAIALMIGLGYYFYSYGGIGTSHVRADSSAVTKSEPSPN